MEKGGGGIFSFPQDRTSWGPGSRSMVAECWPRSPYRRGRSRRRRPGPDLTESEGNGSYQPLVKLVETIAIWTRYIYGHRRMTGSQIGMYWEPALDEGSNKLAASRLAKCSCQASVPCLCLSNLYACKVACACWGRGLMGLRDS